MAVKLNQSFDTLYNMEFMEYSMHLNILKNKIDESNNSTESKAQPVYFDTSKPVKLDVPNNLKLK